MKVKRLSGRDVGCYICNHLYVSNFFKVTRLSMSDSNPARLNFPPSSSTKDMSARLTLRPYVHTLKGDVLATRHMPHSTYHTLSNLHKMV